jgi:hypothetical protein
LQKLAPLTGNPALTVPQKYGKILPVAADVQYATVAQLVEQLTRNEQVACSNQVSSSKTKSPKSGFVPSFLGIFLFVAVLRFLEKSALITLISP